MHGNREVKQWSSTAISGHRPAETEEERNLAVGRNLQSKDRAELASIIHAKAMGARFNPPYYGIVSNKSSHYNIHKFLSRGGFEYTLDTEKAHDKPSHTTQYHKHRDCGLRPGASMPWTSSVLSFFV